MNLRSIRRTIKKHLLTPAQFLNFLGVIKGIILFHLTRKYFPPRNPFILVIEPTNRCNFHCPLCDRGSGKLTRPEGIMAAEDFDKIISMGDGGLKMVLLWNQGEPLINKHFPEMVKAAKRRHIFTIVSTNGSLLDKDADKLVDSGLDEIIISLDGASRETYDLYRRGGDFDAIVENAKKLVILRGKRLHPLISLQFLLLKHNTAEIAQFKRLADEIGADRVLWKTVQVNDEAGAEEYLPAEEKYSRYRSNKFGNLKRQRRDCRRILFSAVIDWNGNTVPCCFDKDEDFIVGNVLEEGLNEVWRGEKFAKFRARIAEGERPEMCSNCTEGLERLFVQ